MKFREKLPAGCPPNHAVEDGCSQAFRLIGAAKPAAEDFLSSAASKSAPPHCDPCRWASCSFYTNLETLKKKRQTFPKLKKKSFYAELNISSGCGKLIIESDHIDFWMFDHFDPIKAITKVAPV